MALSVVQHTGQSPTNGTSLAFTLGSTPAAGNVLWAFASYATDAAPIATPTGWTKVYDVTNGGNDNAAGFWRAVASGDGTSYTFTTGGSADFTSGSLYEITGTSTANPVNGYQAGGTTTFASPVVSPSVTPTVVGCLALAFSCTDFSESVTSVSSGWTLDENRNASPYHGSAAAHRNALTSDTTTAITCSFTLTGGDKSCSATVLINPAPVAAGTFTRQAVKRAAYY